MTPERGFTAAEGVQAQVGEPARIVQLSRSTELVITARHGVRFLQGYRTFPLSAPEWKKLMEAAQA